VIRRASAFGLSKATAGTDRGEAVGSRQIWTPLPNRAASTFDGNCAEPREPFYCAAYLALGYGCTFAGWPGQMPNQRRSLKVELCEADGPSQLQALHTSTCRVCMHPACDAKISRMSKRRMTELLPHGERHIIAIGPHGRELERRPMTEAERQESNDPRAMLE
jgi:hypothetical protein